MKKLKKIGTAVSLLIVTGGLLYSLNEQCGNPITKRKAKLAAEEYITRNYPNENLKMKEVVYNAKMSEYVAHVALDTSIDTQFYVYIAKDGKVYSDSYEDVESGRNTYWRLEEEYRELVDSVFESPAFLVKNEFTYGRLRSLEDSTDNEGRMQYGIDISALEKDKQYDIKEVAKSAGYICIQANDKEVTFEKASELLLQIKQEFDQANVPFYTIDFVLEESAGEDKFAETSSTRIEINDFLYSEINEEGLEERVKAAHEKLAASYEIQEELKKDEA